MRALGILALVGLVACTGGPGSGGDSAEDDKLYADEDGDTIADLHEGTGDEDQDGTPNTQDRDSDGDGLKDGLEAGDGRLSTYPYDSDSDGKPDFLDRDSDDNCVADQVEGDADLDLDGRIDAVDSDDDGDGIGDIIEIGEACGAPDSDQDGTFDYQDTDSDGDGALDLYEGGITSEDGTPVDTDDDGTPDYLDDDSDGDGRDDDEEIGPDGEPLDTDEDGVYDFQDFDNDGDGIVDSLESAMGLDPDARDSDGDGQSDLVELVGNSNPLDPSERFHGLVVAVPERTTVETAIAYELSLRRVDLGMLIDVTTSMVTAAPASVADLLTVARTLADDLYDPHIGVGVFSEFSAPPMSSGGGDVPFRLLQQLTGDLDAAASALKGVSIIFGGNVDWPEASMEALHQAATGTGYDLECDGSFSASKDVLPFISSKDDPFGGSGGQAYNSIDDTTGDIGGMGFRASAIPIFLLVTDAQMRDPDDGYDVPGGCPAEAGMAQTVKELQALGAYFVGLSVSGDLAVPQMTDICEQTGSYGDPDGTGTVPLVFSYTPGDPKFLAQLVKVITDLGGAFEIETMWPEVKDDPNGFVTELGPTYDDVSDEHDDGDILDFSIELWGAVPAEQDDTAYLVEVDIESERGLVDAVDVIVVVPGRTL